jgi:hypothetical protein
MSNDDIAAGVALAGISLFGFLAVVRFGGWVSARAPEEALAVVAITGLALLAAGAVGLTLTGP